MVSIRTWLENQLSSGVPQVTAGEIVTDTVAPIQEEAEVYFVQINEPAADWHDVVRFDHDGGGNKSVHGIVDLVYQSTTGGSSVHETNNPFSEADLDGSFGTTGSTTSISTNCRLAVDGSDDTIMRLQIQAQEANDIGFVNVVTKAHPDLTVSLIDGIIN